MACNPLIPRLPVIAALKVCPAFKGKEGAGGWVGEADGAVSGGEGWIHMGPGSGGHLCL